VQAKSVEAVREEEVKLLGVAFVKEVGFKPGLKERGSYRIIDGEWRMVNYKRS